MLSFKEFIRYYAEYNMMSLPLSREEIQRFVETFKSATIEYGGVLLPKFIRSETVVTSEKDGVNPKTGEKIKIKAKRKIRVKAATDFAKCLEACDE